jgi:hypothetical protein
MEKLKVLKQDFVVKYWQLKEDKFVTAFTKFSPNLGYNSS